MKKVLVIITTAFVRTGGLASVMMNYWRVMDKAGMSFDFASTNAIDDLLYEEISKEGCHYYQLPPRKHVLKYFNTLRKLCKGYDVIHVHANSATSVIELLAAKMAGVPKRIHHNHTSKTQHPLLSKLLYPIFKCTYTDAVACSEPAGEWLFGRGKFLVLPNAIDIDKFKYDPQTRNLIREEFEIGKDDFVVGHIGKFMDAKNHEFLIKVFATYHSNHPLSKLMLVGDGAWRSKIEGWVAQSGCADSIILAGLRSDIPAIVQAFDVFVFPSIYEGLPLTVLEAQSSGLPCIISSNVTKAVNLGRDVIMKDLSDEVESWAEKIDSFDYAVSRAERSEQNYDLITRGHFNIKNEAQRLVEIYNK
jgi:glycosyltransferase involved in cell wall biosynthesis